MIRRAFVRAMSCGILTTLLGVKAWRLEVEDDYGIWPEGVETPLVDLGDLLRRVYDANGLAYRDEDIDAFVNAPPYGLR